MISKNQNKILLFEKDFYLCPPSIMRINHRDGLTKLKKWQQEFVYQDMAEKKEPFIT